ncbi:MAG: hypothetical protein LC800_05475, partial [Acidobacteria bacterium]|nr:hypothetical protein [Acidobacteriota bacterium]
RERVAGRKQQYTRRVRRVLSEVQGARAAGDGGARPKVDLTVATYALFGMMNWIYNWYDPRGHLTVSQLVEQFTRLFLSGWIAGDPAGELRRAAPDTPDTERPSVWRGPSA